MTPFQIAIVGAGPAGCAAAYRLKALGHEVVLFEKAQAIGGRLFTYRADGFYLDTGAAFLTSRHYPRLHALAAEADFEDLIQRMNRITGLYENGTIESLNISSAISFMRYRFLKMRDKLKMGLWTLGMSRKRNVYDLADPMTVSGVDSRSVAEFARSRLSDDIYNYLVRPSMEPFWYTPCEKLSEGMFLALTARAPGAKFFCVNGGIDQICRKLASGVDVRCNTEVLAAEPVGKQISIAFSDENGEGTFKADRLIIAGTATTASKLMTALPESMVSECQKNFLDSQLYSSNIHACFRIPRMTQAPQVNAIFPVGPGPHPWAALSFHRAKDSGLVRRDHELVSLYMSGFESIRMMDESDERLYDYCLGFARTVYPAIPADAVPFCLVRRPEAISINAVGRYGLAANFQKEQQARRGPVLFCGDYLATATIEGAVATGLAATGAI